MRNLVQDLRYGLRTLTKNPGFTAVAIVTLALGIGAATAMFTVVDGVLLKPLRYRDADRIVALSTVFTDRGRAIPRLTGADYIDIRDQHRLFDAIATYSGGQMGVQVAGHAEFVGAMLTGTEFMIDRLDESPATSMRRSTAWLVGGFAFIAFILAIVGLYGVVAYSVGQRTREIGVRMALGARRATVYRLVLGEASRLILGGALLGIVCSLFTATMTKHLLFGVESWDPATLVITSMALIVTALIASYVPARRAASVDPIEILRDE